MIQIVNNGNIQGLLGFHGKLQDGMMCLESINVISIRLEDFPLDKLAEAVFQNKFDDFVGMLFLGVDPSNNLINGEWVSRQCGVQLMDWTMALRMVSVACLMSATMSRSSKIPQGT